MNYKKQIYFVCLILSLVFILTPQAQAVPQWLRNLRIAITPQRPAVLVKLNFFTLYSILEKGTTLSYRLIPLEEKKRL